MLVVFLHGWSVTHTGTYGGLPAALLARDAKRSALDVEHLFLSKYVSFADEVTVDDLARGMQHAISTDVLPKLAPGERFAIIAHSTGGPVARKWIDLFYGNALGKCPVSHLVMLAPANHGSALAQLGKSRLARMKFFADGVEPGNGVLDWLELGSEQGWALNRSWLNHDCLQAGVYLFVLTGQSIDRQFYDSLNSYTGEAGSDGVVRVAAASMNYGLVRLVQTEDRFVLSRRKLAKKSAFGVLPGLAHSGTDMGILASVPPEQGASHPTLEWVRRCLQVGSVAGYRRLSKALDALTAATQAEERRVRRREVFLLQRTFVTNRYCMFVFRLVDDRGNELSDYDVIFTAGPKYDENHLAPGFFKDRQRNLRHPGKLVYYIDYDVLAEWLAKPELEGKLGFRIRARPARGYSYYTLGEYRGTLAGLERYIAPNQTIMVEIELTRRVAEGVFRLSEDRDPGSFVDQSGGGLPV